MVRRSVVEQGTPAEGSLLAVLSPWLAVAHQEPSLSAWRLLACAVEHAERASQEAAAASAQLAAFCGEYGVPVPERALG